MADSKTRRKLQHFGGDQNRIDKKNNQFQAIIQRGTDDNFNVEWMIVMTSFTYFIGEHNLENSNLKSNSASS